MTKKKEVSEAKAEKSTKAKPATTKANKASAKAESSAVKTKKTESPKAVKQEKTIKKAAPKKAAEKPVLKKEKVAAKAEPIKTEKIAKAAPAKPEKTNVLKKPSSPLPKAKANKETDFLPQETLFPEIAITISEKEIITEQPKRTELTIAAPIIATEQKIEILKASTEPVPAYFVPETTEQNKKVIRYENIIANDFILEALKKAGFTEPNETLQKALGATLRGSDLLLIKPKLKESFLIASLTSAAKILSESLPKGSPQAPSVLFLSPSDKKSEELLHNCQPFLKTLGIQVEKAVETNDSFSPAEPIDILIATPKTVHKFTQNKSLKLKQVGLCFCYETQAFTTDESFSELEKVMSELPHERTQKVIVANENTPPVREIAFEFLEEPEYVTTLPSQIKERSPKQFAHSLQAVQKFQVLLGHLKTHKPSCAVIFANTKPVAEWLAYKLHGNGIKLELVTSHLSATKKAHLAKSVHTGDINIIVTTDILAKNLGIKELNCLYNFDLPNSPEQFMNRLGRIEGAKNPIAVSFICEDYGFNMKAIENALGFRIHIAHPDKNYFNLKDTSDYPLEPSGKVKRIGVVYEPEIPVEETTLPEAARSAVTAKAETPAAATETIQKVARKIQLENVGQKDPAATTVTATTKLYPRPENENKEDSKTPTFQPKPFDAQRKSSFQQAPKQQPDSGLNNRQTDKFNRRDDRAKDALDAARMAAKSANDKRKDRGTQKAATPPKRPSIMNIMVSLVQDALQSAAYAAKDSVAQNIQENLPALSSVLDKFNILKKPLKPGDENKKNPQ